MQVSQGSDRFEFRSPHGMKAAHSRLRTFAGIAVRHLQHFNYPGRAWHDLSGPQDTLTVVLAEIGGRYPDLCSGGPSCDNTFAGNWIALAMNYPSPPC
jgi:hypothetical protein